MLSSLKQDAQHRKTAHGGWQPCAVYDKPGKEKDGGIYKSQKENGEINRDAEDVES
jgi:hypothetical protein